jgi:uncharacterized protein
MVEETGVIAVEVAYAKPEEQAVISLTAPEGTTAGQAVELSGLLQRFPEINGSELKIGVFGTACKSDQLVKQGDRVEIYRPLNHDPKEARRQRALKK